MSRETLRYLPVGEIETDLNQPRREMEAPDEVNEARTLAGLAESIRQYGILQPIRVRALDKHRFRIISGERRFKAALMANLAEVPALVVESSRVLLEQLTENVQRKAMTPLELADAIKELQRGGLKGIEIAKQLGLNQMQVSVLSQLQTVSEPIRGALEEGLIVSPRAAYDMDKLPRHQQFELIDQARKKKQVIGQADVRVARKALANARQIKPFDPPLLAKSEYNALMAILNQPEADEHYNPAADRAAILGEEDSTPVERDVTEGLPHGGQQVEGTNSRTPYSTDFLDTPIDPLVRVPAFTLKHHEFEQLAKVLGELPPPSLAEPGGWLMNLFKRRARD